MAEHPDPLAPTAAPPSLSQPPLMRGLQVDFGPTPSQTVGPYFAYGLTGTQYGYAFDQPFDAQLAQPHAVGEHIVLEGRVFLN